MKKTIRTLVPAALACLLAGCAGQTPKMTIAERGPDPRKEYRDRADEFIENYTPSEDRQPVVYAPERRETADYEAQATAARAIYENISLFLSAKKWESVAIEYRERTGKSVFRLTADRTGAKLRLESVEMGTGKVLYAAEAEIPVLVQMPASIPADLADNAAREMNMIFQFLMNPLLPAKTVSLKTESIINAASKKVEEEPQEFLVGDSFCNRLQVNLKELYGGGLLYLYVSTDPRHEIRRIDFADLVLMAGAHGAISLSFPAYTNREGHPIPETAVLNGVEYDLSNFQVTLMPEPEPEPEPAAEEAKTGSSDESAADSKEEKAEAADEDEDGEAAESKSEVKEEKSKTEEAKAKSKDEEEEEEEEEDEE